MRELLREGDRETEREGERENSFAVCTVKKKLYTERE